MRQDIQEIASQIFEKEELIEVLDLVSMYQESRKGYVIALSRLRYVIPTRPKRPMYYVHDNIGSLPDLSRFVVEQCGSYLDLLIKELSFELTRKYRAVSIGVNIKSIRKLKNDVELNNLLDKIEDFNNVVYVKAKHIYGPPTDRGHYFDVDDSIVVTLLAVKLGEEIKKSSKYAQSFCQDLVLPGQKQYIGNHTRTDFDGMPFDFNKFLLEAKNLKLDKWGRVVK